MRVAYICADAGVPVFGQKGCSVHVQEVLRALLRQGAQIELFTSRGQDPRPPGLDPIRTHRLPSIKHDNAEARERQLFENNNDLSALLAQHGPYDLVYERYSLWSYAGMEFARAQGAPGVLEVNSPLIEEQSQYRSLVHRELAESVAKRVFSAATAVVAVSQEVADYLGHYLQPDRPAHVVPNGVDPDRFDAPRTRSGETFTIGFVGTLKPWHGLSDLIEAFATLHKRDRQTRLRIVGDGPERERLMADVSGRDLSHAVCLTGAVPPAEIPSHLAEMDVAVAPYPKIDSFYFSPLKIFEYLAAGLPVVASRCGQIPLLIEHEATGLLYPPGDTVALAAALLRLRENLSLGRRLGQAGRDLVLQNYTWEMATQRILLLAGMAASLPQRDTGG